MLPYDEMPERLFVRGALPERRTYHRTIAMVGSRRCTKYGETVAYETAYKLAQMGFIIVSGLAYGIDACAHRGCLDAGGTTIAVLGTPIDQIYPRSNLSLAKQILERGAIVSEYAPGAPVYAQNFVYRNRIVVGLADATIIVEASLQSGTMSTASYTLAQNKDVYVVPGDITRPMSAGCLKLLKDGAMFYTEPLDLMHGLNVQPCDIKAEQYRNLSSDEQLLVSTIKSGHSASEDIIKFAEIPPAKLATLTTMLELKNIIKSVGNSEWALV